MSNSVCKAGVGRPYSWSPLIFTLDGHCRSFGAACRNTTGRLLLRGTSPFLAKTGGSTESGPRLHFWSQ